MSSFSKIAGVSGSSFQVGLSGPIIKDDTSLFSFRNSTDTDYVVCRGATPVGSNDLVNKAFLEGINSVASGPTGFPNRTDSTWTFSGNTLTVIPAVSSYDIWFAGVRHTISSSKDLSITDVEGTHLVYFDTDDTLKEYVNPTVANMLTAIRDKVLVGLVYWDADSNASVYVGEERHGCIMDGMTHYYLHYTRGLQYVSGLGLGDFVIGDGSLDSHAQFSIEEGSVSDEDIGLTISPISSTTGLPILYRSGLNGYWRSLTQAGFACYQNPSGTTNRLMYNQLTGGSWQLTEIDEGNYVLYHIFATTGKTQQIYSIMGQAEYATQPAARLGAQDEIGSLLLGDLPSAEIRPIATVIFQTDKDYGNSINARIIEAVSGGDDYIDWRTNDLPRGSVPSDHGSLTGLSDDDHSQYALLAGRTGGQTLALGAGSLTMTGSVADTTNRVTKGWFSEVEATTIVANTVCRPDAVDGAALGNTIYQWSDLFLASGAVVNWDNGNVSLTHSAATLTLGGSITALVGPATFSAFNSATTQLSIGGAATTLEIGKITDTVTHNYSCGATDTGKTKTINIGTGSTALGTVAVTIGSTGATSSLTMYGGTTINGTLALGSNNLTMTGSIASTGSRVTKGWFTDLEVTNAIAGSVTGNAATVTTADESADTACYVLFANAATGSQSPKTNANLTFNASTGVLTGTFSGSISNAANLAFDSEAADTTCYLAFITAASPGNYPGKYNSNLSFNSSTAVLSASGFSGPLTGNVTGNCSGSSGSCTGNAATASQVSTANEASDTSCSVLFGTTTTGNQQPKTNTGLTYNSSAQILSVGASVYCGATIVGNTNIEINSSGSGNRYAFIDFHGDDTYTDYALRIIRSNTGENAPSYLYHRGTGTLTFTTQDAADMAFATAGVSRFSLAKDGAAASFSVTATCPGSDDGSTLGTTSYKWSDLFLASGGVINWASGDVTVTHSGDTLSFAGATKGYTFDNPIVSNFTTAASFGGALSYYQQLGTAAGTATMALACFSATAATAFELLLYRSKNASAGSATVVADGDGLGKITWYGAQQTGTFATQSQAAQIRAEVDGTVTSGASGDMPGRIVLATTADGSGTVTDRLILDKAGVFKPATNDGVALGTGALSYSDLFLATGGVINWGNGEVVMSAAANELDINDLTSIETNSTTLNLFEKNVTTFNFAQVATTLNVACQPTTASTHSYSAAPMAVNNILTINIGTGGNGGAVNINLGTSLGGGLITSNSTLAMGSNSITMTGSLASTGSRVTKGWFTDLECTNAIVGSITGNAATVTTAAETADTSCALLFANSASAGNQAVKTSQVGGVCLLSFDAANIRLGIGLSSPVCALDVVTGSVTSSSVHIGEASEEGMYLTSTVDSYGAVSAGVQYVSGSWTARATSASSIVQSASTIGFYSDTSLTDGNTYTPTLVGRFVSTGGLQLPTGVTASGTANYITYTGTVAAKSGTSTKTLTNNGSATANYGWLTIYSGTTAYYIPIWAAP